MEKPVRYDRQLRLWAASGQARLERSHVMVVSGNTLACEILKNLVLPGIGEYSILDPAPVSLRCLSLNFMLGIGDVGGPRAVAAVRGLSQLNPNTKGYAIVESLESVVDGDPAFWDRFSAVVITEHHPLNQRLLDLLWSRHIPAVLACTMGLFASLRIQVRETTVVDTHRQPRALDLRILCPWPELRAHVDAIDLDALDDAQHSHVPHVVILIKAMDVWRGRFPHSSVPLSREEKAAFRAVVENMARLPDEQNFAEALAGLFRAHQPATVPGHLRELFADARAAVTSTSSLFWIYVSALARFCDNRGSVPLDGVLPDMTADTHSYVLLQQLYRDQAQRDQHEFTQHVAAVLHSVGAAPAIDDALIALFCKNALSLLVSCGSSQLFSEEMRAAAQAADHDAHVAAAVYFAMMAFHSLRERLGRDPAAGDLGALLDEFLQLCRIEAAAVLPDARTILQEVLVHPDPDYHNACSLMGGLASQEVLKIATAQYLPLDNVLVYDGIRLVTARWKIG